MLECKCECHCTCNCKCGHLITCGTIDSQRPDRPTCCDKCKQLPENFTFDDLCFHSYVLACLYKQAKYWAQTIGRKPFCANAVWYSTMKPIVELEVGYCARNPKLESSLAYDVAYDSIYQALPNCRHEGMCGCL